jgi:hypothetical protein
VNLSPFDFRFVWAQHALMSMTSPAEIRLGGTPHFRFSHDAEGTDVQRPFDWPSPADGQDLSRPDQLPPRLGWKVFSAEPIASPATVLYPSRRRSLTIEYLPAGFTETEAATPAWWGIWVNTGGWAGHRHFAIEPTTGRFDALDRCVHDRSAGTLPGSGRRDWAVRWTVGPA